MNVRAIWIGLGDSRLLADVDSRDRVLWRIGLTVVGGLVLGFVAAFAGWALVLAPYTMLIGKGALGLGGLASAAAAMADPKAGGLSLTLVRLLLAATTDGVFLLAFVALAAVLAHRRLIAYINAGRRVRWRLLFVGMALSMVVLAPLFVADRVFDPDVQPLPLTAISPRFWVRALYMAGSLLLIPAAAAEELFFRGWLLRTVAAFSRRPWILLGVTGVIFSALHFEFSPDAFLTRALMGAGFAYMALRLGGIEFAAGVHAAHNIMIILFLQPLILATNAHGAALSVGSLLEDAALVAGYVVITEAVARMASLRRLAALEAIDISPISGGAVSPA